MRTYRAAREMKHAVIITLLLATACTARVGDGPSDVDGGVATDGGSGPDATVPVTGGPARYSAGELRSPITESVVNRMRAIYDRSGTANDVVFMKVGASGTVSSKFLDCFSGSSVDLDGRTHLQSTIDYYNMLMASGVSSWERNTLAAVVGRSASWAISGDPSPIEEEISAINPRIALVNYGTNDMSLGITHETALWPFVANFNALLDELEGQGIIPVITGLNPRSDNATAADWVPTYNSVVRAIAEKRQLPFINLYLASVDLPDMGLVGDGLHGNGFGGGSCVFTSEGLQFNYNARNLLTLEALNDVKHVAIDDLDAPDGPTAGHTGTGAADDAFVVDGLPFTHSANTATSPHSSIDAYASCDAGQDESGPELYYRLEITEKTPVRIMVLDRGDVDVDIHLLSGGPGGDGCIDRDHRIIERTLLPGTYYISVDSFVNSDGVAQSGEFSLVVVKCADSDTRCE